LEDAFVALIENKVGRQTWSTLDPVTRRKEAKQLWDEIKGAKLDGKTWPGYVCKNDVEVTYQEIYDLFETTVMPLMVGLVATQRQGIETSPQAKKNGTTRKVCRRLAHGDEEAVYSAGLTDPCYSPKSLSTSSVGLAERRSSRSIWRGPEVHAAREAAWFCDSPRRIKCKP
jgi:hypothetical protein